MWDHTYFTVYGKIKMHLFGGPFHTYSLEWVTCQRPQRSLLQTRPLTASGDMLKSVRCETGILKVVTSIPAACTPAII